MYWTSRMKIVMKHLTTEGPSTFDQVAAALGGDQMGTVATINELTTGHFVKARLEEGMNPEDRLFVPTERGIRRMETFLREMN